MWFTRLLHPARTALAACPNTNATSGSLTRSPSGLMRQASTKRSDWSRADQDGQSVRACGVDRLIVLHSTRMPAVLLEAGSIINRQEELELADVSWWPRRSPRRSRNSARTAGKLSLVDHGRATQPLAQPTRLPEASSRRPSRVTSEFIPQRRSRRDHRQKRSNRANEESCHPEIRSSTHSHRRLYPVCHTRFRFLCRLHS
jgi:hypothetical protein